MATNDSTSDEEQGLKGHIGTKLGYIALATAIVKQNKRPDDDRVWLNALKANVCEIMGNKLITKHNTGSWLVGKTSRHEVLPD